MSIKHQKLLFSKTKGYKLTFREKMLVGFQKLDIYFETLDLDKGQKAQKDDLMSESADYKKRFKSNLKDLQDLVVKTEAARKDSRVLAAFTNSNDSQLSQAGYRSPFKVISEGQALELKDSFCQLHETKFSDQHFFNSAIKDSLASKGLWNINFSGLFQAIREPQILNLLKDRRITNELAPVLGEDQIIWRSQFFEKRGLSTGTFWHQTSTFQENSKKPKLLPPSHLADEFAQLTVWVALTDTDKATGCLRIIPESFKDQKMEVLFNLISSNPLYISSFLNEEDASNLIDCFYFSAGNFIKAQFVVELLFDLFPNYMEANEIVDLEMKAGEAVIFSSMNMHASYGMQQHDSYRLALAGRYTTPEVKVYQNQDSDYFATPDGNMEFGLEEIRCLQVRGTDKFQFNRTI